MFIDRDGGGLIVGTFARPQRKNHEKIADDSQELLEFLDDPSTLKGARKLKLEVIEENASRDGRAIASMDERLSDAEQLLALGNGPLTPAQQTKKDTIMMKISQSQTIRTKRKNRISSVENAQTVASVNAINW